MIDLSNFKIQSDRLLLKPLSLKQLVLYKNSNLELDRDLGVYVSERLIPGDYIDVIENSHIPYITINPDKILFGTIWIIIERDKNVIIGDIGFKGAPSVSGIIEIGYEIFTQYRNVGFASEAIALMTAWAFSQPSVTCIVAETRKDNISSHRALVKNAFVLFFENIEMYWWRLDNNKLKKDEI